MNKPLASAILAVGNGEQFMSTAIESVLDHYSRPWKIIDVDGQSVDDTADVVRFYEAARQAVRTGWGSRQPEGYVALPSHHEPCGADKLTSGWLTLGHRDLQHTVAKVEWFLGPGVLRRQG